jgi:hypothetical protein
LLKVVRRIYVCEQRWVEPNYRDVEALDRSPDRAFTALESGKCALAVGARKWTRRGHGRVAARHGKLKQGRCGYERGIDRQNDGEVGRRCTEPGGQPHDGGTLGTSVVEDREREFELVLRFADSQPVGTGFAERSPTARAECQAFVDSERLGRAEACACAADEQDSGQVRARQWLSDAPDCVCERLEVGSSLSLADQVAEERGVASVAAFVGRDAGEVEQCVDGRVVQVELGGREPGGLREGVARTCQPRIESRLK